MLGLTAIIALCSSHRSSNTCYTLRLTPPLEQSRGVFLAQNDPMTTNDHLALLLHRIFRLGIWLKGFDGILEIIGGGLLLAPSPASLNRWIVALTQHELIEDPHDWIATSLRHTANQLS